MKNILVPSVGRRVELVKLLKENFDKVVGCGMDKYMPASYFCDDFEIVSPVQSEGYIEDLKRVCKIHDIKYILPVIDIDCKILSQNKEKLAPIVPIVSSEDIINECFDKKETLKLFKKVGVNYAKVITSSFDKPTVVRPKFGFGSKQVFFCKNYEDALSIIDNQDIKHPIIQEKIIGDEYTTDIYVGKDGEIYSMNHRLRMAVRGGEISQGKIVKQPKHVEEELEKIVNRGFWGPINIQYILDKDKNPYFIEINPRFGGGLPMTVHSGQNQVFMLLKDLSDLPIPNKRDVFQEGMVGLRYDQTLYVDIKEDRSNQAEAMEQTLG